MPLGLDIFDKLAKVCDAIRTRLVAEKDKLASSLDRLPIDHEDTAIGKWYARIKWDTRPEEVLENTSFSTEDARRLAELQLALFEDSKKKEKAIGVGRQ